MSDQDKNHEKAPSGLAISFEVEGTTYSGSIVRIADNSVILAYDDNAIRLLALPSVVTLHMQGGSLPEDFEAQASLGHWLREADRDCLCLELSPRKYAALELAVFPQRSERTSIRGSKAIRVAVQPTGNETQVTVALVDISESGAAVILSPKDDLLLAKCAAESESKGPWHLRMSFQLPGNENELKFVAELCYRKFMHKCIKYGVRFDLKASAEVFPDQQSGIEAHIECFKQDVAKLAA